MMVLIINMIIIILFITVHIVKIIIIEKGASAHKGLRLLRCEKHFPFQEKKISLLLSLQVLSPGSHGRTLMGPDSSAISTPSTGSGDRWEKIIIISIHFIVIYRYYYNYYYHY